MNGQEFRTTVLQQFARIGQAFASPGRLELLDLLSQGERDVESLARETGLSLANASRHLQLLKGAHLVECRKDGVHAYYRLAHPLVHQAMKLLQTLAEHQLPEVKEALAAYGSGQMEAVSREELLRRVEAGKVVVLDVRPHQEYESGHIPGALSVPLSALSGRLGGLPLDQEIVAYCRGPYCVLATEAVEILRQAGYRAWRLEEGVPDWKMAGLPVESGALSISP